MSRAPRRWIDDAANAPPGAGDLLRAARAPDAAARARVWEAVQSSTAAAATTATAATTAAAAKVASGGLLAFVGVKPAVVAVALVAGSLALRQARVAAPPAPRPVATAAPSPPEPVPPPVVIPVPVTAVPPQVPPTVAPRVVRPVVARARVVPARPVVVAPAPFTVDDELAAFASARSLLATDPATALSGFDGLSERLGSDGGALAHERARYAVDALHRLGRDDEARPRAEAFLAAHPTSTVAPAMRALVGR